MISPTRASLRMRCWTERDSGGGDPYGGGQTWSPQLDSHRCVWWVTSGREQINESRSVVLADEHLIVDHGADIRAGDRIVKVVDNFGRVVFEDVPRVVEYVAHGRQHLDCSLRAVT